MIDGAIGNAPYLILDVPLIPDAPLFREVDRVCLVDVEEGVQFERLVARNGMDAAQARQMQASQPGLAKCLAIADDVIDNNGCRRNLELQVRALHDVYVHRAR